MKKYRTFCALPEFSGRLERPHQAPEVEPLSQLHPAVSESFGYPACLAAVTGSADRLRLTEYRVLSFLSLLRATVVQAAHMRSSRHLSQTPPAS